MDSVLQLISNVGFPIAMCLMLFWYITNTMKSINATLIALQKTVDNNTAVVERLNLRIDSLENK